MNTDLHGKRALVVGMARSGLSAADFLWKKGAQVKVSEKRPRQELEKEIRFLQERGIDYEVGEHREEAFLFADLIVVSPGVPLKLPQLQKAVESGKEVISEVELASRFLQGKVIGVTGSNGKTTTTTLIGEILKTAGFPVQIGGNIGTALTSLVEPSTPQTTNVVELSSFQLEAIPTFRPDIAVVLNLTPDHLDRYDSFVAYMQAKLSIFKNQTGRDFAVVNLEDGILRDPKLDVRSQKFWFSISSEVARGTYFDGKDLVFRDGNRREVVISREAVQLRGKHNLENVSAAITAASLVHAVPSKIAEAIKDFKGVEHRLELVAEIGEVLFYNDSKATNTDAAVKALEAFDTGINLILGGKDKGSDFFVLGSLIKHRVKNLILLGEASKKISLQLSGTAPIFQVATMDEAVELAFRKAIPGSVVLLAPACASFDMFHDYEHRGRVFKDAVRRLKLKNSKSET